MPSGLEAAMRIAAFVAVAFYLASAAAGAAPRPPEISARAPQRSLDLNLNAPAEHVCTDALEPEPWRDASDPVWFATGPTARLDGQELAAGTIVSLIAVRLFYLPRLLVLGVPLRTGLHFSNAGWHARWPFC
jgi:hypothetical protein